MQLKFKTAMWHNEHELRQRFQISIKTFGYFQTTIHFACCKDLKKKEINTFIQQGSDWSSGSIMYSQKN